MLAGTAIIVVTWTGGFETASRVMWSFTAIAAGTAAILLGCHGAAPRATAPLRWMGRHSYELYLFHIIVLAAMRDIAPARTLPPALLAAWLALFLEACRRSRHRARRGAAPGRAPPSGRPPDRRSRLSRNNASCAPQLRGSLRPLRTFAFGYWNRPMKALCWHGKNDIRCDTVPDPTIEDPRDVIIKVTACAICGSDLHLMDGMMPTMESGDVLGHEFMGEVVEVGAGFTKFKKGDRIVVPFNINCGQCRQCKLGNYSACQRSNRNAEMAAKVFGYPTAGLFGYSHMTGGYWGGQAEYVRVPMADFAPMLVPEGMSDDDALFLSDIFPTGYQGAEQAGIKGGEIVAIWGAGPVGYFAIQSARVLGAERIIVIETVPERIALARKAGANRHHRLREVEDVLARINEISRGEGADVTIDCVGMEASGGHGMMGLLDKAKEALTPSERITSLNQAIMATRPGGVVVRAGRLWRPDHGEHGRHRPEEPEDGERADQREALSRAADQDDPGGQGRHDLGDLAHEHEPRGGSGPLHAVQGEEGRLHESGVPPGRLAGDERARALPWTRQGAVAPWIP